MNVEKPPLRLPPSLHAKFGYGLFSARYGNIYTARQLLQLAQEAFGERPTRDHIAWSDDDGRWFDALRPGVEPEGLASPDEVFAHRKQHLDAVRKMFISMDILVFTLGLTEAWEHRADNTILPTPPGTIAGKFDPSLHAFTNLSFEEVRADLLSLMALMERHRSSPLRYLLTVSPVPLAATATSQHVMVATVHSKAILRAAVGEVSLMPEVDYFPSFEIIANPWNQASFYEPDFRGVTLRGVETVMSIFSAAHIDQESSSASQVDRSSEAILLAESGEDQAKCEEALLQAFSETAA